MEIEDWNLNIARQKYHGLPEEARRRIAQLDDELNMGHLDTVRTLLAAGADVNGRNAMGQTPLLAASYTGQAAMVRLLLEHGADKNARNFEGKTALQLAAELGFGDVVQALTE
jgi:ankyrin repeat protein